MFQRPYGLENSKDMERFLDILENILSIVFLVSLCLLALGSVFVWHDWRYTVVFTICIILWLYANYRKSYE